MSQSPIPARRFLALLSADPSQANCQILLEEIRAHRASSTDSGLIQAEALALILTHRYQEAIETLDSLAPQHRGEVDTWQLRGMAYRGIPSCESYAYEAYRQAHVLQPDRPDVLYNLANCLLQDAPEKAVALYLQCLDQDPWMANAWFNLGIAYMNLFRIEFAAKSIAVGLLIDPESEDAYCNYGLCLVDLASSPAAERAFRIVLSMNQANLKASTNLGNVITSQCNPRLALPHLIAGAALDSKARLNLGLCQLLLGDFESGLANYESRLDLIVPPLEGPRLTNLDQCNALEKPLLIWAEQGLGDSIMFSRYLKLLDARSIPYILFCPKILFNLFSSWMKLGSPVLPFDRLNKSCSAINLPLLSLPKLFQTRLGRIPATLPYLQPPSSPPLHLKVPVPPGGLSIGLVWSSDPSNRRMYQHKSLPLDMIIPRLYDLVRLDLVDLHSLQLGEDADQLSPWIHHPRVTDWSKAITDFESTAYIVSQLDLVISVDTAVAHLAGALSKPTWLLLPANADFRWLSDQSISPWYPGCMRLFRQSSPGDWQSVVDQLHDALDRLFLLDLKALAAAKLP